MSRFATLDDLDVAGKRVLLRVDLNVPMQDGKVTDATRIERLVPTLDELRRKRARVVVLSHFGRPKGKPEPSMSLKPLVAPLSAALGGADVAFASDCVGQAAAEAVGRLRDGQVVLLENLRFHAEEEKNDPGFAKKLAALGDIYVNDAFSAAHRAHASTEAIARLLPSAAGRLMQAELEALGKSLDHPARPLAAVVGGAKVSTKLDLLGNLINKVDILVIGGGMANTFLFASGVDVGKSLCEREMADTARRIAADAIGRGQAHRPAGRRGGGAGDQRRQCRADRADRPRAGRCDDPRHRAEVGRRDDRDGELVPHPGVERSAGRVRARALRQGDGGAGQGGREADGRGQAAVGRRRRRHGGGTRPCRGRGEVLLRLDRGRRLPRMARGQGAARRRGAYEVSWS